MEILEFNRWLRKNFPNDRYLFKDQFAQMLTDAKQAQLDPKNYYIQNRSKINPKKSVVALVEKKASIGEIAERAAENVREDLRKRLQSKKSKVK